MPELHYEGPAANEAWIRKLHRAWSSQGSSLQTRDRLDKLLRLLGKLLRFICKIVRLLCKVIRLPYKVIRLLRKDARLLGKQVSERPQIRYSS